MKGLAPALFGAFVSWPIFYHAANDVAHSLSHGRLEFVSLLYAGFALLCYLFALLAWRLAERQSARKGQGVLLTLAKALGIVLAQQGPLFAPFLIPASVDFGLDLLASLLSMASIALTPFACVWAWIALYRQPSETTAENL